MKYIYNIFGSNRKFQYTNHSSCDTFSNNKVFKTNLTVNKHNMIGYIVYIM